MKNTNDYKIINNLTNNDDYTQAEKFIACNLISYADIEEIIKDILIITKQKDDNGEYFELGYNDSLGNYCFLKNIK